jgi:hypothetical protein
LSPNLVPERAGPGGSRLRAAPPDEAIVNRDATEEPPSADGAAQRIGHDPSVVKKEKRGFPRRAR